MMRLTSIVVPTLQEDVPEVLSRLEEALAGVESAFELVFVDDSPPAHHARQREAIGASPGRSRVQLIDGPRRGKGAAVRCGVRATSGSVVFTMDADLPIPLEHVGEFLRRVDDGADVVIAERPLDREFDTWKRYATSRGLLLIQRALVFHSREFKDTQCGFKAFRGDLARDIARTQVVDGGMYDLEYLFDARRLGVKIVKVPVACSPETRESRIDLWRCFSRDWIDVVRIRTK